MAKLETQGERADDNWRDLLSRRLLTLMVVQIVIAAVVAAAMVGTWTARLSFLAVSAPVTLGLFTILRNDVGTTRHRSVAILLAYFILGAIGYIVVGPLAGPSAATASVAMLAGVLLGRRAMYLAILASIGIIAIIAALMVSETVPAPAISDIAPTSARMWVRTSLVALFILSGAAAAVTYVVERLEATVESLRRESVKREHAELERLKILQAALESQNLEAIGRLAAGVAHDFNNMLHVVRMWCGILKRSGDSSVQDALTEIEASTTQAARLASQLLVLGHRDTSSPKAIEVGALVEGFQKSLGRVMTTEVTLKVELARGAIVFADEIQLQQVLLNLAMNARDAMPAGGTIKISVWRTSFAKARRLTTGVIAGGEWVVLEVADTGAGMDPEVRDKVFEPFYTTKSAGEGTGLGLATLLTVAHQSGGEVDLWSEPARGTRISLWLPACAEPPAPPSRPLDEPIPRSGKSFRILLVEDHEVSQSLVARVLRAESHTVITASDASAALESLHGELAANRSFDLLLTDVVMPGLPISELLTEFERVMPDAKILLCSGYVGEELARRGIAERRYPLLPKPVAPDTLIAAVETAMARA